MEVYEVILTHAQGTDAIGIEAASPEKAQAAAELIYGDIATIKVNPEPTGVKFTIYEIPA